MKLFFTAITFFAYLSIQAQSEIERPLEEQFEVTASEWMEKSEYLKFYAGVNEYCRNPSFRKSTNRILKEIHAYDSLIIARLEDPTAYFKWDAKEEKKTLKDIEELEADYGLDSFIDQMRKSCLFRNEIEENSENLKNGVGAESYDGKILILETEITKYLKKIDRLVLRIDEHLHVLHLN